MDDNFSKMKVTFGGGCFWCTEAIFQKLEGVHQVLPGYMGGKTEHPTYEEVCRGDSDHVEVIQLEVDENKISFNELLAVFFKTHDPTTLNRQGNDIGTQYRSVIFYHDTAQKEAAERFITDLNDHGVFSSPIVTAIEPAEKFWEAEDYHHDYFNQNPNNPYCIAVVAPKLQKFLQEYR